MTIRKLAALLMILGGVAACASGPPQAPIGLNRSPANPTPIDADQG